MLIVHYNFSGKEIRVVAPSKTMWFLFGNSGAESHPHAWRIPILEAEQALRLFLTVSTIQTYNMHGMTHLLGGVTIYTP